MINSHFINKKLFLFELYLVQVDTLPSSSNVLNIIKLNLSFPLLLLISSKTRPCFVVSFLFLLLLDG